MRRMEGPRRVKVENLEYIKLFNRRCKNGFFHKFRQFLSSATSANYVFMYIKQPMGGNEIIDSMASN